jgi:hypothetical protein
VADQLIGYVPPAGSASHKLRTRQVGTDGGLPVIVEYLDESVFGISLVAGQATVATGTEAALSSQAARRVYLAAPPTNTNPIALGGTGVTMATGFLLFPGQQLTHPLTIENLNVIHAITDAASQKLAWMAEVPA